MQGRRNVRVMMRESKGEEAVQAQAQPAMSYISAWKACKELIVIFALILLKELSFLGPLFVY